MKFPSPPELETLNPGAGGNLNPGAERSIVAERRIVAEVIIVYRNNPFGHCEINPSKNPFHTFSSRDETLDSLGEIETRVVVSPGAT